MSVEEQRRELADTLATLSSAREEQGGKIDNMDEAVRGLTESMQNLETAQFEANRRADIPTGNDADLARFTSVRSVDVAARPGHYAKSDSGAIRLRGHVSATGGFVPGLLDGAPKTDWHAEFQDVVTTRNLVRKFSATKNGGCRPTPIMDEAVRYLLESAPAGLKRIFADAATGAGIHGEDLIPDQVLPGVERAVQFTSGVSDLFETRGVPRGGLFRLPFTGGNLFPTLKVAATGNDPANAPLGEWTSDNNTIETLPLVVSTQLDREAAEEALIAVMPEVSEAMARGWQFGKDNICINGHTAGTQDDNANWDIRGIWTANSGQFGGTADHRRLSDGLRRDAFSTSTTRDQAAELDSDGIRTLIGEMDAKFFANMVGGDLVILASPEYYLGTMLGFTDMKTWDAVGPNASILTGRIGGPSVSLPGQVGSIFGIPVVSTAFLSADMNAVGVFDNVTLTKTGMLVVSREQYEWRQRQSMMIETDTEIRNDTITLVGRMKTLFRKRGDVTEKSCAYSFNLPA